MSQTQYTQTGNRHTGKCKYWKYVVEAELFPLYEHQQETKGPFLALFWHF